MLGEPPLSENIDLAPSVISRDPVAPLKATTGTQINQSSLNQSFLVLNLMSPEIPQQAYGGCGVNCLTSKSSSHLTENRNSSGVLGSSRLISYHISSWG